jgi:hypothetical protein
LLVIRFAEASPPKLSIDRNNTELGGKVHERNPGFGVLGGFAGDPVVFRAAQRRDPLRLVRGQQRGRFVRVVRFRELR